MKVDKENLRMAMARACMNPKDIAEKANMPKVTVSHAVCGMNVMPKTVGKIAKALGVDVSEIIKQEGV